jgi:hypothetical protein
MKFKKLQIICLFIFGLFTGVAQAQALNFELNLVNTYAKGNYFLPFYHPLSASIWPAKTEVSEFYDATTNNWDEYIRINYRHTPNCARVASRDIINFRRLFNLRDTNIYVGNLLTASVLTYLNIGLQYGGLDFKYITGSVQPDTIFSSSDTRTIFTYNANGVASALVQERVGSIYQNKERFTYNHNAAGEQIFYRKEFYDSSTVTWISAQTYVTTYNAAGKISSILDTSNSFRGTNDTIVGLTYDAQNRVTSLVASERTVDGTIEPIFRFRTLNFETNGHVKEAISEDYVGGNYVAGAKFLYKYANDERLTEILTQVRDGSDIYFNFYRERIEYCGTGVNLSGLDSEVKLYPNPVTETLNVELEAASFNNAMTVEVLDVTGRSIKTQSFSSENAQINVSELPQGVFFVRVQSGSNSAIKRFVRAN